MLGVSTFEGLQEVFKCAKSELSEILSAFEFFDRECLRLVKQHITTTRTPFETDAPFYVLIETSGSRKDHGFLENVMTKGLVEDGAITQNASQAGGMWPIRESITESLAKEGGNYKFDLSVPVPAMYSVVEEMRARLARKGLYQADGSGKGRIKHVVGTHRRRKPPLKHNIHWKGSRHRRSH